MCPSAAKGNPSTTGAGRRAESGEAALKLRRLRAALKEKLATEKIHHRVEPEKRACPRCGRSHLLPLGEGKKTVVFEYVPGHFVRQEHMQETLACPCGEYLATADPPPKVIDKGRYGPGFIAHLITMKCADSLPIYRLAKQYQRIGIPMARSTMTDLFHVAAELLTPLSDRLLALIAAHDIVQADETSLKMLRSNKRGFVWTFIAGDLIAYKFSGDRSGATPLEVLGGTTGTLVVDAYTGYNILLDVDGRTRAGCIAHLRRRLFDALATAPEAKVGLEMILDAYRVEHEAKARGIVRSNLHLTLRRTKARAAMDRLHAWLLEQQGRHAPKSPMGSAVNYALSGRISRASSRTRASRSTTTRASGRCASSPSDEKTSCMSVTRSRASTSRRSTHSLRPARLTRSIRSRTSPTCSSGSRRTLHRASTSCCRTNGSLLPLPLASRRRPQHCSSRILGVDAAHRRAPAVNRRLR